MIRNPDFPYLPKDFIQTDEGLVFAVVNYTPETEKVACFLRYIPDGSGWKKVGTEQANEFLEAHYPKYLYYSDRIAASFHAVEMIDIVIHHRPEQRIQQLLSQQPSDEMEEKLHSLIPILQRYDVNCSLLGLTGSMLIGQQKVSSDIDLVLYTRIAFHQARQAIKQAIADKRLKPLDQASMLENYQRRAAQLDFDEFSWHEFRKYNKAIIDGSKFDIGMVCLAHELEHDTDQYQKQGIRIVKTKVVDDHRAFDYPAYYKVDDELTPDVLSFTHTYVGQAKKGEVIEVSGTVECNVATGKSRLIVGSTREAKGEYIKVCR